MKGKGMMIIKNKSEEMGFGSVRELTQEEMEKYNDRAKFIKENNEVE